MFDSSSVFEADNSLYTGDEQFSTFHFLPTCLPAGSYRDFNFQIVTAGGAILSSAPTRTDYRFNF